MDMGKGNGTNIALMILSLIGLVIGPNLLPTIIASFIPTLAGDVVANNASLTRTVMGFIPVACVVGMLAIAFVLVINTGMKSGEPAEFKPVLLIFAVITIVVGINLVGAVGSARNSAIASATGPCTAAASPGNCTAPASPPTTPVYVGAVLIGTGHASTPSWSAAIKDFRTDDATSAGVLTAATAVANQLSLTRTVTGFIQIGYIVSILAAGFSLANVGAGGRLSSGAAGAWRTGSALVQHNALGGRIGSLGVIIGVIIALAIPVVVYVVQDWLSR